MAEEYRRDTKDTAWRTKTYRALIYRKERKMWRSLGFGMLTRVYGIDFARDSMREATDDQLQEFIDAYVKALSERGETSGR